MTNAHVVPDRFYIETYDKAAFDALCDTFEIEPGLRGKVLYQLEGAAAIWRYERAGDGQARPSDEIKALRALAVKAKRTSEAMDALPGAARRSLASAYDKLRFEFTRDLESGQKPVLPNFPIWEDSGEVTGQMFLELAQLDQVVQAISILAARAAQNTAARPGGRVQDYALYMWMANMHLLWVDILKRPFTRDQTEDNMPISPAARFCVEAFAFVDPATPRSRVLTEMKKRISEDHGRDRKKQPAVSLSKTVDESSSQ